MTANNATGGATLMLNNLKHINNNSKHGAANPSVDSCAAKSDFKQTNLILSVVDTVLRRNFPQNVPDA